MFSYVIEHDLGFAPNPFHGACTLACCKPVIRKRAQLGDYILGTGAVVKRPVVIDDANLGETIAVRQMVYLALTYDHRLVDGADAARFLTDVKGRLEAGQFEV